MLSLKKPRPYRQTPYSARTPISLAASPSSRLNVPRGTPSSRFGSFARTSRHGATKEGLSIGPKQLFWTAHSRVKMRFYGLSEQRVRRIIHSPKRIEEGIAPKTIAMMQPSSVKTTEGKPKWSQELWVMIKDEPTRRKIISAWRYPGMTKPGDPLPKEILRELRAFI